MKRFRGLETLCNGLRLGNLYIGLGVRNTLCVGLGVGNSEYIGLILGGSSYYRFRISKLCTIYNVHRFKNRKLCI